MAANKPDFSLSRIDTPDVGGGLLDFADRQQKQYQIGLSNAVEADKLLRDRQRFAREQELNARADTEYNREVSGRKALQDYASKPLDISTMLGTQTKTADEAIAADANRRVALWDKSLADNNITQDDVDKGRVSKELLGKLYNPALDVNASTGIQKTYESITPFREDVESRIEKDLIAQNVDPMKAKQYAQMEGQKYQSIPEYQAMLTAQAEKMTNNSKEQFKDNLELTKFNREVYKDELDKYKIKMDNLTKMMGSTGSGGTGGGGSLSQDKSKAYDEVYAKAGNSNELASKLDAAFQVYGAKAVNNALAASGINEPVRLLEWDVGKRDASLERFDNALKNEKPLSEVQGQFGSGAPNAPTYSLPTPATVYTADSARSAAQDRVKNSVLGYLGDSAGKGVTATGTTAEVNPNVPLSGGGKSVLHINGVPDSLILNEGLKTDKDGMFRSYIDTNAKGENKGLAVAGGYNYSNKSPQEIKADFKAAGISDAQAEAAINKEPIKLSEQQGKDLFAVGYKRLGEEKASKLLPEYKDMNPFIKEIAADMAYRGDLVPGSNGYQGDLVKVLKTNDVNKVYDYVNNNNIPVEVKQRLGTILTVERDSSWYEGGPVKPTEKKVDIVKEPILSTAEVKNKQDMLQKLLDDSKTYTTILAKGRQTEDTVKDLAKTNRQIAVIRKELSLSEDKNNSVFESPITQPILSDYDRSMARRNYLQVTRTGKPFKGRTADEWKALIK